MKNKYTPPLEQDEQEIHATTKRKMDDTLDMFHMFSIPTVKNSQDHTETLSLFTDKSSPHNEDVVQAAKSYFVAFDKLSTEEFETESDSNTILNNQEDIDNLELIEIWTPLATETSLQTLKPISSETPTRNKQEQKDIPTVLAQNPSFNNTAFIMMDSFKNATGELSFGFTANRFKTFLGNTQGNHVIAHRLFLQFCARILSGCTLETVCEKFYSALNQVLSPLGEGDNLLDTPTPITTWAASPHAETEKLVQTLPGGEAFITLAKESFRMRNISIINNYISDSCRKYSRLKYLTLAQTQDDDKGQSNKIASAIKALNCICRYRTLASGNITEAGKLSFFDSTIEPGGIFVGGVHVLYTGKKIVDKRQSINGESTSKQQAVMSFWTDMGKRANDPEKIGRIIALFFEYKLSPDLSEKNLDIALTYRDKMAECCIEMALQAFPALATDASFKEKICKSFHAAIQMDSTMTPKATAVKKSPAASLAVHRKKKQRKNRNKATSKKRT